MKTLLTLVLFALTLSSAQARMCQTTRGEVEFRLEENKLVFYKENPAARDVAQSTVEVKIFKEGPSLTQVFLYQGDQHIVHFANRDRPDHHSDYYMVTNTKGESMLYPLDCSAPLQRLGSL